MMEIERKFLVGSVPEDLDAYDSYEIEQAYLSVRPTIRIRKAGEKHVLTVKGPGKLSHEEFELEISEEAYQRLMKKCDGRVIVKRRHRIPYGQYVIELDVFTVPAGLVMAEVEFPTEKEALAFEGPSWFGEEVTYDGRYSNAALAMETED